MTKKVRTQAEIHAIKLVYHEANRRNPASARAFITDLVEYQDAIKVNDAGEVTVRGVPLSQGFAHVFGEQSTDPAERASKRIAALADRPLKAVRTTPLTREEMSPEQLKAYDANNSITPEGRAARRVIELGLWEPPTEQPFDPNSAADRAARRIQGLGAKL